MPLAVCVAALFEVDLMKCDRQSRTNWGVLLHCFVGQVSPMGGGSVSIVAWIQGDEFGPRNHCHLFVPFAYSVAPSDALAGLYASYGRGRPLLWPQSYNETREI